MMCVPHNTHLHTPTHHSDQSNNNTTMPTTTILTRAAATTPITRTTISTDARTPPTENTGEQLGSGE
jgi:hypothetical protein